MRIDPENGFTSDVIRDPGRFVGRVDLIRDCVEALNSPLGLIAVYGKRGVGKSSLLRQVQQMALGDYTLAKNAGLVGEVPKRPRTYLTVYYTCDAMIDSGEKLITRLCNDQDEEDGLLRLVPNEGKELVEFGRAREVSLGADLKVVNWGAKGIESSKFAKAVPNDPIQTFRNFTGAVVTHQVKKRMHRDALLILLDEFDVLKGLSGFGSLVKSLSTRELKFGVSGIGQDLVELIQDHASIERLLEQGAIHVKQMTPSESFAILERAEELFAGQMRFAGEVKGQICDLSDGYPYFTQLFGKECVNKANSLGTAFVNRSVFDEVLADVKSGRSFPTLESAYQRAIGDSPDRQLLLHLLAEQPEERAAYNEDVGRIVLKRARREAEEFNVQYVDQLIPRLVDAKYGPILSRVAEKPGVYEFVNPVFRLYVRQRTIEQAA
jgi:hypothetical protein